MPDSRCSSLSDKGTHQVLTNIYRIDQEKIFLIPNGLKRNQYINSKMDKNKLREQYYIDDKEKVIFLQEDFLNLKGYMLCWMLLHITKRVF